MTMHAIAPSAALRSPSDPRGLGGLLALAGRAEVPLPLLGVRVRAVLTGSICRTVVEQRFRNTLSAPMEAVHLFPVPEAGAVTEVELRCGDLVVRAECRERKEAEERFQQARVAGHRAALLTRERDDIHTLRVTNLPPGEEVTVRIVVVEHLEAVDGLLRWRFPTTIAPRYLPGTPQGHEGPGILPDTDVAPDASRLQPPLRLSGGTPLDLEVQIEGLPTRVVASLHAVSLELGNGVRVAPAASATCDRDFVLGVSFAAAASCGAHAWTDGQFTLVTVDPPSRQLPAPLARDAVFVVDISGSMEGEKLVAARRALKGALHGLLAGDRFQVLAFDDRVERFARGLTPYTDAAVAKADAWIDALAARGGTEMLAPIQESLAGDTPHGRLRTVLFITDGQAHNEAQLAAAVHNRRKEGRFFALGIDTAVNGALLTRLARMGGGTCELCTPQEDIEAVVARLEARFGTPLGVDVVVEGGEPARMGALTLFAGRPVSTLLRGAPTEVRVRGRLAAGELDLQVPVARVASSLGALWARERVTALEDRLILNPVEDEAILPEITRVALAGGIASRGTAFVAVEETRTVTGSLTEVVQPHELPSGWSPAFGKLQQSSAFGGAPGGPPALGGLTGVRAHRSGAGRASPPPMSAPPPSPVALAAPAPSAPAQKKAAKSVPDVFADAMSPRDEEMAAELDDAPAEAFESRRVAAPRSIPAVAEQRRPGMLDRLRSVLTTRDSRDKREEADLLMVREAASADGVYGASAVEAQLAAAQSVDGSFGGDVARTGAALVLLLLAGHTTSSGIRQRTVRKAVEWLRKQPASPASERALEALAQAEAGEPITGDLALLEAAQPEGAWLMRARSVRVS